MHIAFYAPMKAPDDARPSGDREMARHLMAALAAATGREVRIASHFSSFDAAGDALHQARLAARGRAEAAALTARLSATTPAARPALWFTYHLYHKAPDWLGPRIAAALAIPYIVAEASHAPKQAKGPWALGHRAAKDAIAAADLHFVLNPADTAGLRPLIDARTRLVPLPPFIDGAPFARAAAARERHRSAAAYRFGLDPRVPWLITAAMMRTGAKLRSYRLLAEALARLDHARAGRQGWRLIIVGDGPARGEVEEAFRPLARRVVWTGEVGREDVPALLAAADVFVWPAIGEAFGVAAIEAQAAGLPVVAGWRPGVASIVEDGMGGILAAEGDAKGFAGAVARLLDDEWLRTRMGAAAAGRARSRHSLAAAADCLARNLAPFLRARDRASCRGG